MTEQRRLAAIVSADVAGYSRLMGRDESGTLAALKALRQELVNPVIAKHGGRIVKTKGDGLLLEFPSVVNAVRCAVEMHTAIAERGAALPQDKQIALAWRSCERRRLRRSQIHGHVHGADGAGPSRPRAQPVERHASFTDSSTSPTSSRRPPAAPGAGGATWAI